jgi:hypothetical protein
VGERSRLFCSIAFDLGRYQDPAQKVDAPASGARKTAILGKLIIFK